ncbi:hypothetical protein MAR_015823 [Mya arenaria]|uniref:Globin domain-containing protein n=1 Tax=Mya arenaria TaxID=6604 RepID=A0ABY7FKZ3_MYAAR|nr:hypothetical protein MAR_015823 [Mya arenaria]
MQVFLRSFEKHPKIKELIKAENARQSELARNVVVKGYASRFMSGIGTAVDNLDDLDNTLAQLLLTLDSKHKCRTTGVTCSSVDISDNSLIPRSLRDFPFNASHELETTEQIDRLTKYDLRERIDCLANYDLREKTARRLTNYGHKEQISRLTYYDLRSRSPE